MDDVFDQRRQLLKSEFLLILKLVPIIDIDDALGGMAKAALLDLLIDTSARHQRAGGAPQIVQHPAADTAGLIELALEFGKIPERPAAIVGKYQVAGWGQPFPSVGIETEGNNRKQKTGCRSVSSELTGN